MARCPGCYGTCFHTMWQRGGTCVDIPWSCASIPCDRGEGHVWISHDPVLPYHVTEGRDVCGYPMILCFHTMWQRGGTCVWISHDPVLPYHVTEGRDMCGYPMILCFHTMWQRGGTCVDIPWSCASIPCDRGEGHVWISHDPVLPYHVTEGRDMCGYPMILCFHTMWQRGGTCVDIPWSCASIPCDRGEGHVWISHDPVLPYHVTEGRDVCGYPMILCFHTMWQRGGTCVDIPWSCASIPCDRGEGHACGYPKRLNRTKFVTNRGNKTGAQV